MAFLQVNGRPAPSSDNDCHPSLPEHQKQTTPIVTSDPSASVQVRREIRSFTDIYVLDGDGVVHPRREQETGQAGAPQINWMLTPGSTVGRALVSATQRLLEAGCETARLDSQVLLAHVLQQDRTWLFAHHDFELNAEICEAYTELVARRTRNEPVAYLLGSKEFYGLNFLVDQRVLIPRPETELLVDLVLAQVKDRSRQPVVVADVGTGSGAIAVSVAYHASQARVYGLDISSGALDVARDNGRRLTPEHGPIFLESDLLENLPEPADIVVANLPYISEEEYGCLQADVRDYEPRLALLAGREGLDLIERLLSQLPGRLRPHAAVHLEIGSAQGEAVAELARGLQPRPKYVGVRRDYSGLVRMVTLEF